MNNLFTKTNLNNFVKKTPNIRDILQTSLNIYPKKNKDTNKDKHKDKNKDIHNKNTHNKNTYIPKIISNNIKFKKKIFINYLNNQNYLNNLINIINLNKYSLQKNLYLNAYAS